MPRHAAYDDIDIAALAEPWAGTENPAVRLVRALAMPFVALAKAIKTRNALDELMHLTDRELADVGAPPDLVARIRLARAVPDAIRAEWR